MIQGQLDHQLESSPSITYVNAKVSPKSEIMQDQQQQQLEVVCEGDDVGEENNKISTSSQNGLSDVVSYNSRLCERLCVLLTNSMMIKQLESGLVISRIIFEKESLNNAYQKSSNKFRLLMCLNLVHNMHFEEPDFPMRFKGMYNLGKHLVQLVYRYLEVHLDLLIQSELEVGDTGLVEDVLKCLITVYCVLGFIDMRLGPVWWVRTQCLEEVDLRLVREGIHSCKLYWGDFEQVMIRLRGKLELELNLNHKDMHILKNLKYIKSNLLKYNPTNTIKRLKEMEYPLPQKLYLGISLSIPEERVRFDELLQDD